MRSVSIAWLFVFASGAASAVHAETRSHLDGDLRPVAAYVYGEPWTSVWNAPGEPTGSFALDAAAPQLDFRTAPGTLQLTTPGGSLTAHAADPVTLFGVLPRDPASNLPLKLGAAEGATCPTGAEPDCWVSGDAIPDDEAVSAALAQLTALPAQADSRVSFGRRDFLFIDEMAALSWNFLLALASSSGDGVAPIAPWEFDPAQPQEVGQCSFATPQYCANVLTFWLFTTELQDDDPLAPPALRWIWEAGALYDVVEATGDLAPYAGGSVHVLGLERARANVAALGVPLVLVPASETLDPETPFAIATPAAPESPSFGLAYATAPEPAAAWLAAAVAGALAALRARAERRT